MFLEIGFSNLISGCDNSWNRSYMIIGLFNDDDCNEWLCDIVGKMLFFKVMVIYIIYFFLFIFYDIVLIEKILI